ncbi:MAG TPA: hypothetical protein VJP40_02210 [bacterium]|nr:hypothetical protein [bacterium]
MKIPSLRILFSLGFLGLAASLQAQGGATLEVTPLLIDFGEVAEGGRGRQNLTLTNLTDAPLDVTEFDQTGSASFTLDVLGGTQPCGSQNPRIAALEACTMEVNFLPEFSEEAAGTLTFTPNGDPSKAITVRLQGQTPDNGGGCSLQVKRPPSRTK